MNLIVGAPSWLVVFFVVILLTAAVEDAVRLRISNVTSLAICLCAIVAMALSGFPLALWQNVTVFVLVLTIGTAAFAAGWLGGGDVKLIAAIGLWFDLRSAVALIAAILIAGGVLAVAYIAARSVRRIGSDSKSRGGKIPYGIAVVVGTLLVMAIQLRSERANSLDDVRARAFKYP
jgi:prepilin peptidase CpaA